MERLQKEPGDLNKESKSKKRKTLKPGEVISVDQMVSPVPGLIAQMVGFLTRQRYKYATVFVDQASHMAFIYLQKTCSVEETIEAKRAFEQYAENHGVRVQAYHADNGIFKAKKWVEECQQRKQDLTFAGVNAHHQNDIAERRIRELQEMTRAMLIHATKRWPGVVTIYLWPYAIRMANQAYNATPLNSHMNKQSPNKFFHNSAVDINQKHWKPFGCPTYVLKSELQGTTGIHPKWDARTQAGINLGQSPIHNRNVALVLNIHTGYVSPQFHVKFDKTFQTVHQDKWNATWLTSTGFTKQINRVSQDEDTKTPGKCRKVMEHQPVPNGEIKDHPGKRQMVVVTANGPTRQQMSMAPERQVPANPVSHIPHATVADEHPVTSEKSPEANVMPLTTRSGRLVKPVPRLIDLMMSELDSTKKRQRHIKGELLSFAAMTHEAAEECNPILAYKAVNPDILRLHEAMKAKDQKEFKTAMEKEVKDQIANGNFTVIPRSKVPKGFCVFPGVWTLVCKRDIQTREIKKYKACLAFDGSRMREGEDYDKNYAPVALWMSIRLLLSFVVAFGWHKQQVDYVAAYTQAPIDRDMYMEFPRGLTVPGGVDRKAFVLKLHRNLYGQKQARRVWYKYLCKQLLTKAGFVQCKHDECLFFRGK